MKNNNDRTQSAGEDSHQSYGSEIRSSHCPNHGHDDTPRSYTLDHPSEGEQQEVMYSRIYTPETRTEEDYDAFIPPKSKIASPPPRSSFANISTVSPRLNRKLPFMPSLSSSLQYPEMEEITDASPGIHRPKYPNLRPLWHKQHYYEQGQHYNESYLASLTPTGNGVTTLPSAHYGQSSHAEPHYYDTFDRYDTFNDRNQLCHGDYDQRDWHYSLNCSHRPSTDCLSQPPQPSSRAYHQEYPNDTNYANYNDENHSHPLLCDYDPDLDGCQKTHSTWSEDINLPGRGTTICSTNHRNPCDTVVGDTAKTPHIPEAASEVDFNVMKPPLDPITQPSDEPLHISPNGLDYYDVLLGRGGRANGHIGNRHFRSLVQDFQPIYLTLKRKEKPLLTRSLVLIVRQRGGRFLRKGNASDEYYEVGDEKAEAKTSQALREGMDVRATTRKRKEISLQQRDDEVKRKKMVNCEPPRRGREDRQVEQRSMQMNDQAITHAPSIYEEDHGYNNGHSFSVYHDEHHFQLDDSLAFESSIEIIAPSSTEVSFSTTIEEYSEQPQRMARVISRDEDDQRELHAVEEQNNNQVHIVPL